MKGLSRVSRSEMVHGLMIRSSYIPV